MLNVYESCGAFSILRGTFDLWNEVSDFIESQYLLKDDDIPDDIFYSHWYVENCTEV